MKKILIYIFITCVLSNLSFAQVDRTKAPEPGPAPEIKIAKPEFFKLKNGLKVYVVENHKLPRIAFSLLLDREPILEGANAGYVGMTGQLLLSGTTNRTKEVLDKQIDFIGASLFTSATGINASSLTRHQEKLLELMADVLYNPSFPQEELDKLKKQTLSELAQSKEDPEAIAGNVRSTLVYGANHPYGELSTEETVDKITIEDCRAYYDKFFKPNISYLAIVGDITLSDAKKLVKKYFSKWKQGEVVKETYETPKAPSKTYIAMVDRPASVQSIINISYPVPLKIGAPDVIKARVLNQILGGNFSSRLMQNLREDKAFTYGARSSLSSDDLVGRFTASASVRNEVTDSAVYEFIHELRKIVKEDVTEAELKSAKASIAGGFGRSLENPQTVARFAMNSAIYNLPDNYYNNYLKNLEEVTVTDVREIAQKYIRPENAHIVVVGKSKEVSSKLGQFGEVKYFDTYGKSYVPSSEPMLPDGLTAEKVIADYITAIGGKNNIIKVKSVEAKYKANMMGRDMVVTQLMTSDLEAKMSIDMGGMIVMESVTDGKNAKISQMGQSAPIDDKAEEELALANGLFSEALLQDMGATLKLTGIEKINEKDHYIVEVTLSKGSIYTVYFDATTGLKSRYAKMIESPQGSFMQIIDYADYKEVNGVKFAHVMIQNLGGQNIKMEATSVNVNVDIPQDTFKVN